MPHEYQYYPVGGPPFVIKPGIHIIASRSLLKSGQALNASSLCSPNIISGNGASGSGIIGGLGVAAEECAGVFVRSDDRTCAASVLKSSCEICEGSRYGEGRFKQSTSLKVQMFTNVVFPWKR